MSKYYTDRWNSFQIIAPSYLDGHEDPYRFDVVKWEQHDPIEVIDWETGEKKMSSENCFVIGYLEWNEKEEWFEFRSVGTRYLEYGSKELGEWILEFAKFRQKWFTVTED